MKKPKTNHAAALVAAAFTLGAATAFGATPGSQIIDMSTVTVGDIGNAADGTTGYGAVSYEYQIGKYEVTNAQYAAFLNAVDSTGANTLALYNSNMGSNAYGGITLNSGGADGSKYEVKAGYGLKPVNFVSIYDAMRFTNWLTTGGTETGVYNLLGGGATPDNGTTVIRTLDVIPGTLWAVASEDEWYKAAYYDGNDAGTYRTYPVTGTLKKGTNVNGGTANYYSVGYVFPNNGPLGDGGRIADVDHYDLVEGASSFYRTYQQGGNVRELNDTIISGTARGMRGGSFANFDFDIVSSARKNTVNESSGTGFRVVSLSSLAAVPEPGAYAATMGLLMLIIGMWIRRGRRAGRG